MQNRVTHGTALVGSLSVDLGGRVLLPGEKSMSIGGVSNDRIQRTMLMPMQALPTMGAGALVAFQNPESVTIEITRVLINVLVCATAAMSLDVGTAATPTTASDNLMSSLDCHSAVGLFDNIDDKGANGKTKALLGPGQYITISGQGGFTAGRPGPLSLDAKLQYIRT